MVLQGIIQSCDNARAQQRKAVLLSQRGGSADAEAAATSLQDT